MLWEPKDIGLQYKVLEDKYFEGRLVINNWPRDFFWASPTGQSNYPSAMLTGFVFSYVNSFLRVSDDLVFGQSTHEGMYEDYMATYQRAMAAEDTSDGEWEANNWSETLSNSMVMMQIEIIDETTYNPDNTASIKVKHIIPLTRKFLEEHLVTTFTPMTEIASISGISLPPDAFFRLVWISDINSLSYAEQTGFPGYTNNQHEGGFDGDSEGNADNWPDVILGTNMSQVYSRSDITVLQNNVVEDSLYDTYGNIRLKITETDIYGRYENDAIESDEWVGPGAYNSTLKNIQFPGVTVGENPNQEHSTPDNNGFTWHQIDATYHGLRKSNIFVVDKNWSNADFITLGLDSIYNEHYAYPVEGNIYQQVEEDDYNHWGTAYNQNATTAQAKRTSNRVYMKPSRCVETIRVWLSGSHINDDTAFTIDNIPQFAGKVFRWKHLKNGNNYGIRIGQLPIVSRELKNLLPNCVRRGSFDNPVDWGWSDDFDLTGSSNSPMYSSDMGVEDLSSLGNSYGSQNSLIDWTGADPDNLGQFYDAVEDAWNHELLGDMTEWVDAHQNSNMGNTLFWMTQHNNNNYLPGGTIFNSVTGMWETVETNPDVFSEYGEMMMNGLDDDTDWLSNLSSHHLMGLHTSMPLNRQTVGYSYKRTDRRGAAGMWTYVDIDVYTRFLNNGPQRAVVNIGIWDEATNDFKAEFDDYRTKYHFWFFVANNHPVVKWQHISEKVRFWHLNDLTERIEGEVVMNWDGDWESYIASGGYIPFANNPDLYDVVANGGYSNITSVVETLPYGTSNAIQPSGRTATSEMNLVFNVEGPQGILARNGLINYKTPIDFKTVQEETYDDENFDTFEINYEGLHQIMAIGDVMPSMEFCRLHTPRKAYSFYDTLIDSYKWPVRVTDIVGNSSIAIWQADEWQKDANLKFTDAVIESVVKDEGEETLKKNCIRYFWCDDTENYLCEEPFPELNPAMDDLEGNLLNYQIDRPSVHIKEGMSFNKYCQDTIPDSCCEPIYPYFDRGTADFPMPKLQDTGVGNEIICGLTTQEVDYFYQQFNQYIGYGAGGTSTFGGNNLYMNTAYGDTIDAWGEHVEYGNELYGRILLEANVLDPENCDCGGSPCLELGWYNQSPCSWVNPYNTDDIRFPEDDCVNCRDDSHLYLDFNRSFNQELTVTGEFNFGPNQGDEDWITITDGNKNNNWLGQYECTFCPTIDAQYFPIDDIYQGPCGKLHGVNGISSMNIVLSDLSNNDFNLSQGNFWINELIFPHEVCTLELKDSNGDALQSYGNCDGAANYPYAASPLGTYAINDSVDGQVHSITVRTCGDQHYHCQSIPISISFTDGNNVSVSNLIIDWNSQGSYEGCTDPLANNYNPNAVWGCDDCCRYTTPTGNGDYYSDFDVEGSNKILSFTADLDRWDQYKLDEGKLFGATSGAKGELILSAYNPTSKTLSSLKHFQGSEEKEDSFTWASKEMSFGYDDVYKVVKKIKVMISDKLVTEEDLLNDDTQLFVFADGEWAPTTKKTEGHRTKVFELSRAYRKCKSIKLVLSASKTIESISVVYTMKSVK